MRALLFAMTVSSVAAMSPVSHAQTFDPVGSGPISVTANLWVRQTLILPVSCNFTIGGSFAGSNLATTMGASPSAPYDLCYILGQPVQSTSDWVVETIPGDYTKVKIKNISANALDGTCGPGELIANVSGRSGPVNLTLGTFLAPLELSGSPLTCYISGAVTITGVRII